MVNPTRIGAQTSQYRILGLVGQGQFGQVFCAAHRQTGKLVALKNLERERFPTHQFLQELGFLLSFQHPNVVACSTLEVTRSGRYLVMDYCEGGTLRQLMGEDVHLPFGVVLQIMGDVLRGLDHIHQQNVVHCDIKPDNILLSLRSKGWHAKISDFGIARLSQAIESKKGENIGSPAYMAPERFYNHYSIASDLYAVGIMFYELLMGYRPFTGTPQALMNAHLNQSLQFPAPLPADVPLGIKEVIHTALQKLPARRFQSAMTMLETLYSAVPSPGSPSRPLELDQPLLVLQHTAPCRTSHHQHTVPVPSVSGALTLWPGMNAMARPGETLEGGGDRSSLALAYSPSPHQIERCDIALDNGVSPPTPDAGVKPASSHSPLTLPDPIQQLLPAPQGYVAVTQRALFWIHHREQPRVEGALSWPELSAKPLYSLEQRGVAAIEPGGRWLAMVTDCREHSTPTQRPSALQFYALPGTTMAPALSPSPIPLQAASQAKSLLQAIALDARHLAIFSDGPPPSSGSGSGATSPHRVTYGEIFTRRGDRIAQQHLPMMLGQIVATPTPYRLLATDQYDSTSILSIDLKPFRIHRIALDIRPHFLMAAPWGNIVADRHGKVVFIDTTGYTISALQLPTPLTSLIFQPPHFLMSATTTTGAGEAGAEVGKTEVGKAGTGKIHLFDLTQQDIDWVF